MCDLFEIHQVSPFLCQSIVLKCITLSNKYYCQVAKTRRNKYQKINCNQK